MVAERLERHWLVRAAPRTIFRLLQNCKAGIKMSIRLHPSFRTGDRQHREVLLLR